MVLGSSGLHKTASVKKDGRIQVELHPHQRGKGPRQTRSFIELVHPIAAHDNRHVHALGNIEVFLTRCLSMFTRRTFSAFTLVENIYLTWKEESDNMAHSAHMEIARNYKWGCKRHQSCDKR